QNMNLYSFFINTYFKYPLKRNITTYFTLDPGYTFNKSSTIVSREENTNFVLTAPGKKNRSLIWNIGVGSILKLKKNIFMDIAYRYTTLGKISHKARGVFIPDQSERVNAHTISIGLMYKFY
ncbi:MAG: outer membrane beta-barrel protein, partial [Pseudomonadota bacterium]